MNKNLLATHIFKHIANSPIWHGRSSTARLQGIRISKKNLVVDGFKLTLQSQSLVGFHLKTLERVSLWMRSRCFWDDQVRDFPVFTTCRCRWGVGLDVRFYKSRAAQQLIQDIMDGTECPGPPGSTFNVFSNWICWANYLDEKLVTWYSCKHLLLGRFFSWVKCSTWKYVPLSCHRYKDVSRDRRHWFVKSQHFAGSVQIGRHCQPSVFLLTDE